MSVRHGRQGRIFALCGLVLFSRASSTELSPLWSGMDLPRVEARPLQKPLAVSGSEGFRSVELRMGPEGEAVIRAVPEPVWEGAWRGELSWTEAGRERSREWSAEIRPRLRLSPSAVSLGLLSGDEEVERTVELRSTDGAVFRVLSARVEGVVGLRVELTPDGAGVWRITMRGMAGGIIGTARKGSAVRGRLFLRTDLPWAESWSAPVLGLVKRAASLKREPGKYRYQGEERWQGMWDSPNRAAAALLLIGGFCAAGAVSGFALLRCAGWAGLVVAAWDLAGSYSRGGWVAAFLALGVWIVFQRRRRRWAGVCMLSVFCLFIAWHPGGWARADPVAVGEDRSVTHRLDYWEAALAMLAEHPEGVGVGSFNANYQRFYAPPEREDDISSAISDPMTLAAERGWLGAGLWAAWCGVTLGGLTLALRAGHQVPAALLLGVGAFLTAGLFSTFLDQPDLVVLAKAGTAGGLLSLPPGRRRRRAGWFWRCFAPGAAFSAFLLGAVWLLSGVADRKRAVRVTEIASSGTDTAGIWFLSPGSTSREKPIWYWFVDDGEAVWKSTLRPLAVRRPVYAVALGSGSPKVNEIWQKRRGPIVVEGGAALAARPAGSETMIFNAPVFPADKGVVGVAALWESRLWPVHGVEASALRQGVRCGLFRDRRAWVEFLRGWKNGLRE